MSRLFLSVLVHVGILAAGTNYARVVMWKYKDIGRREVEGADRWEFLTSSGLAGPLTQVKVGSG